MKKLLFLCALGISLCANAQLTVFENGSVQVGNDTAVYNSTSGTLNICSLMEGNPGTILPAERKTSGSITFGSPKGAKITGYSGMGSLNLYAE